MNLNYALPVAEVLEYLHVQDASIVCRVVGSSLALPGQNADAILGYGWTGFGGHHALWC